MRGELSQMTAADICRRLAASRATGRLTLEGDPGTGTVTLVGGAITAAESPALAARTDDRLAGAGYLEEARRSPAGAVPSDALRVARQEQVLDALFDLQQWRHGVFEFVHDDVAPGDGVALPVDVVVTELVRRQQGWDELTRLIPDLDVVPTFQRAEGNRPPELAPDEVTVLRSIDGQRSVHDLAAELGYSGFELARIVHGLIVMGLVDAHPAVTGEAEQATAEEEESPRFLEVDLPPGVVAPDAVEPVTPEPEPVAQMEPEPEPDPEPVAHADPEPEPEPEPEPVAQAEPEPVSYATPEPEPEPASGSPALQQEAEEDEEATDISELLRELSRLAIGTDEPPAPPVRPTRFDEPSSPPRPPTPTIRRADADEGKRRKRGRFGRGS
jgi:hypothetical protein